jgi:hypothetical protein
MLARRLEHERASGLAFAKATRKARKTALPRVRWASEPGKRTAILQRFDGSHQAQAWDRTAGVTPATACAGELRNEARTGNELTPSLMALTALLALMARAGLLPPVLRRQQSAAAADCGGSRLRIPASGGARREPAMDLTHPPRLVALLAQVAQWHSGTARLLPSVPRRQQTAAAADCRRGST